MIIQLEVAIISPKSKRPKSVPIPYIIVGASANVEAKCALRRSSRGSVFKSSEKSLIGAIPSIPVPSIWNSATILVAEALLRRFVQFARNIESDGLLKCSDGVRHV